MDNSFGWNGKQTNILATSQCQMSRTIRDKKYHDMNLSVHSCCTVPVCILKTWKIEDDDVDVICVRIMFICIMATTQAYVGVISGHGNTVRNAQKETPVSAAHRHHSCYEIWGNDSIKYLITLKLRKRSSKGMWYESYTVVNECLITAHKHSTFNKFF